VGETKQMSDSARTARIVALMAGNGFGFIQVHQVFLKSMETGTGRLSWPLMTTAIIAIVGMAAAYGSLRVSAEKPSADWLERIALGAFLGLIGVWLGETGY
jgi:hypothetical protein